MSLKMTTCGAKTRSGQPCKKNAMANGRCKNHGGNSTGAPKANKNAKTHGIYEQYLTDDEQERFADLEINNIDNELRLTKIRLARALKAEFDAQGQPELEEIIKSEDGGEATVPRQVNKSRTKDYVAIIDKLTARVESLTKTRKTLLGDIPMDTDTIKPQYILKPDEPTPNNPIL